MITETYKGRKIRIVKGRGNDFGYSRVTLNGTELGKWLGDEARVLQSLHGYIDVADRTGINGDKYGVEWYAPGTFEVCENGHPKEIGGECLHSYCIERRPIPAATEPTGRANVREVSKTLKAAGFTPYNPERGGSRSGYQASQDGPRVRVTWREGADTDLMGDKEREESRKALNDSYADTLTAVGYPVRERTTGGPVTVLGSKTRATVPVATGPEVTEYSVKIWYRSGAYEGVAHSPEDLARQIFADAVKSAGVEFAELHGPSGKLVESKTPNEESPVTTEPEPQENLFLAGLPLLHPEPLPPAPELPQEPEPTA